MRKSEYSPHQSLIFAAIFGLAALLSVVERVSFLSNAEHVMGEVDVIEEDNDRCRAGRRSIGYDCTKFYAVIRYDIESAAHYVTVPAGSARGHFQSAELARHRVGEFVPVIYDRKNPDRANRDSFLDLWWLTLILMSGFISFVCCGTLPHADDVPIYHEDSERLFGFAKGLSPEIVWTAASIIVAVLVWGLGHHQFGFNLWRCKPYQSVSRAPLDEQMHKIENLGQMVKARFA